MARRLGSSYTLEARIGRGGMGEVWRGRDEFGTALAFKLLLPELTVDPEVVARFMRERSVLIRVDSPFVVRVRDLVAERGQLALVMDLVEGSDLRRELRRRRTVPPAEAVATTIDILTGLGAAHTLGIVHRDLKPENVLLDRQDGGYRPKVSDFGIAGLTDASTRLTTRQGILGTPLYMAPEMIEEGVAGPPADIYAAGLVLYEQLCGVTPFTGRAPMAVLRAHVDLLPGRPPGISDELWSVLAAMLAKDPAARADVDQLRAVLPRLRGVPASPPLAAPPPPASRTSGSAGSSVGSVGWTGSGGPGTAAASEPDGIVGALAQAGDFTSTVRVRTPALAPGAAPPGGTPPGGTPPGGTPPGGAPNRPDGGRLSDAGAFRRRGRLHRRVLAGASVGVSAPALVDPTVPPASGPPDPAAGSPPPADPAVAPDPVRVFVNTATQGCLDSDAQGQVYTLGCNGGDYQRWEYTVEGDGARLRNAQTGNCVASTANYAPDGSKYRGSVYAAGCDAGSAQRWTTSSDRFGMTFRNVATGECLDGDTSGSVYTQDCNNGNFQHWGP